MSLLSACASTQPVMKSLPKPVAEAHPPAPMLPPLPLVLPASVAIAPPTSSHTPLPAVTLPQPQIPLQPANIDQARALLQQLLPTNTKDRNDCHNDILTALSGCILPNAAPCFCATLSIIE